MLNYLLYRCGQFIALHLPKKCVYGFAVFCSDLHYLFAFKDHRAVRENLEVIFPNKPARELQRIRLEMSRNFAKYLADFFRFEILDRAYIDKYLRLDGIRYFDEALTQKKGVVVLTAHLGNWELGGAVAALLGYPLWAVVLEHKDKRVNAFFNYQRQSKGMKVIPLGKAVRKCLEVFRNNEMVALVGDRDFTEKGVVIDFFGKLAHLPEGPAAFAVKTGAVIVPAFTLRNADDTFTLKVEKPIEFTPCGDQNKDILNLITLYKKILEDYIRKYPEQWYMFRRFWIK
ncbi:MAG: lysophospholipid acyltransferase family protein [Candidatus Omnitrophota bacterium]